MDDSNSVDLITIDFSKTFDKIPYKKLQHKLLNFGIDGCVFNWIKNFLCERNFNVRISSCFSNLFDVNSSVPQGSKLDLLLYIIYANDIEDIFKFANIKKYTDDLIIYAAVNDEYDRKTLQFELNLLCEWYDKWGPVFQLILINVNCYILVMVIYIFNINLALLI